MKLSIVIPAHNEEHRLQPTLESYAAFFQERMQDDFEIIVVANHCADKTVGIAQAVADEFPQITIEDEPAKIGKGGAVELGMRQAKGELIGFVDADGATPPEAFSKLLENLGDAGCIIGSRWIEGALVNPPQSWMRRLASRILNKMFVQGMFGLKVRDSQCGAKVFRADVLDKVLPESSESGWAFDIDLLCRIKRLGYGIREFPIEWHHVPGNPINFILMSVQMVASVWRVKRTFARM